MDFEMRGIIQKYIEAYVKTCLIPDDLGLWNNSMHNFVVNTKSALLGQIYGGSLRLLANLKGVEEDELSFNDRTELRELFVVSVRGISSVIDEMLGN